MALERMEHLAIRTDNLKPTVDFYTEVLGLREGPRPDFGFPGHWLYLGDTAVIHLIHFDHRADGSKFDGIMGRRDKYADDGTGSVDHIAFRGKDFDGMKRRLQDLRVPMKENFIHDFKISQLFIEDPNGVTVEVSFFNEGPAALPK
jgi:catechol 2,3-dioxygenase-like lactoylglutathione lyase family enzyme